MATSKISNNNVIKEFTPNSRVNYDGTNLGIVNFLNDYNTRIPSDDVYIVHYTNQAWQKVVLIVAKVNNNYGYAKGISFYNNGSFRLSSGSWAAD